MSNAIAVKGLPGLPEKVILPDHGEVLSLGIWHASSGLEPGDDARMEAMRLLVSLAPVFGPPKFPQVRNWLQRVNLGMSQPASTTDFDARMPVISDAIMGFMAGVFTIETSLEAIRRFKWFPGGAELAEFLETKASQIRFAEWQLRQVAEFVDRRPPPKPAPTQAEKDAVAEILGGLSGYRKFDIQEPVRSIDEQIAELKRGSEEKK